MQWNKASSFEYRKLMETGNMIRIFQRRKAVVEQILASEETNPNKQDCESHSLGSE